MNDYRTEDREKVGQILDQFNQVEGLISEIITAYVNPMENKKYFMYSILLNASITPTGSKIKVLLRINEIEKYVKLKGYPLHRMLAIRNAVAHKNPDPHYGFTPSELGDGTYTAYLVLEKLGSNGKIEYLKQDDIYQEFKDIYEELWPTLMEMKKNINDKNV